ncbi:hypothetical protein JRQ81_009529 [Phrynocephalus forsythii]|uniref:Uncharacterized protein n=1 Tax=Phrynocephalus forsythii TaxID=171643 RepID=A0A9Q1AS93_9SAUR|nr:hypothetical protein JRQ81_009529 [Phrynocephalus forsythii]
MSASALRRKSYKKAQEESGPFSPVRWEGDGGGEVPSGKMQVMEKFFTPVQRAPEGQGMPDGARQDGRSRPQWTESRSGHFTTATTTSSSSSASATSSEASWSSEASLEKEAFLLKTPRYQPQHSQSCLDVSREARAFPRRGRDEPDRAAYGVEEPAPSLRKGHSKSAERFVIHKQF